jgi:hypothetical protein
VFLRDGSVSKEITFQAEDSLAIKLRQIIEEIESLGL